MVKLLLVAASTALIALPATAATYPKLETLSASQTFPAIQSTITYGIPTGGKPQSFGNFTRATSVVRYDAATNSYIVRDTGDLAIVSSFGPSSIDGAASNSKFTVYRKTGTGLVETFRRLNPGATNPLIALSYVGYGEWKRVTTTATGTATNDTYLLYGAKTASADMPVTGSASYSTILDGTFVNKDNLFAVSGSGSLTANFGAGTIVYSATPVGTAADATILNFGSVGGTGSIATASASFTGNPNSANPTYAMSLKGYFYGPAASEVGANFRLTGGGGNGTGVMVGH